MSYKPCGRAEACLRGATATDYEFSLIHVDLDLPVSNYEARIDNSPIHRRVPVSTRRLPAKVANMARPSKGDRGAHMIRNHPAVTQRLVTLASAAGSSSVSQYAADVLAVRVGLPEHVRERDSDTDHRKPTVGRPAGRLSHRIMIRPHRAVSGRLA